METLYNMSVPRLCSGGVRDMGFHPKNFRHPPEGCNYRSVPLWDHCWSRECASLLSQEWGCQESDGPPEASQSSQSGCVMPFKIALLQVRHPLKTISSLVAKFEERRYCGPDWTAHSSSPDRSQQVDTSLYLALTGIFPEHDWASFHCVSTAAWYFVLYYEAMGRALDTGDISAFYRSWLGDRA